MKNEDYQAEIDQDEYRDQEEDIENGNACYNDMDYDPTVDEREE